jgi:hypothetical protein
VTANTERIRETEAVVRSLIERPQGIVTFAHFIHQDAASGVALLRSTFRGCAYVNERVVATRGERLLLISGMISACAWA